MTSKRNEAQPKARVVYAGTSACTSFSVSSGSETIAPRSGLAFI